jgi:hypothetical protein
MIKPDRLALAVWSARGECSWHLRSADGRDRRGRNEKLRMQIKQIFAVRQARRSA